MVINKVQNRLATVTELRQAEERLLNKKTELHLSRIKQASLQLEQIKLWLDGRMIMNRHKSRVLCEESEPQNPFGVESMLSSQGYTEVRHV